MFTLSSNIIITNVTTGQQIQHLPIVTLEIDKSRKTLTNTAKIVIPRSVYVEKNGQITSIADVPDLLTPGSEIEIQIGYDGNLTTEFKGFISEVSATIPIEIKCQDAMWSLKQNSFTKSWGKGTKVSDIISYIYSGLAVVADLEIGSLVVVNQSTAQILAALKKYGLQCYFGTDALDNNTLYVDFAFAQHTSNNTVAYDLYQNVISNDLMYKLKKDARIQVIGVSTLDTGKKIQIVAGDVGGEKHTLHYYNMDADQLQKVVTSEINHLRYEGYKFSFKTFGIPIIEPGDIAMIQDAKYPEHAGSFLIESVKTTFGTGGFRRDVHPELKVD